MLTYGWEWKMMKVFVAGNPLIEEDSLALQVAEALGPEFREIKFQEISSLSEAEPIPMHLYIIDVAMGVQKVEVVRDLSKLGEAKLVSLHDLDIGMELLIYKKLGKIGKVSIIAIPLGYKLEKAVGESKSILGKELKGI